MPPDFPGMNPYLETSPYWEILHQWFIFKLADLHVPSARALGCEIDVERRVYRSDSTGQSLLVGWPDALATPVGAVSRSYAAHAEVQEASTVAIAEAIHEIVWEEDDEQPWQDYLVIREKSSFRRVVAAIELLSPQNKDGRDYCRLYREKLKEYESSQTNFMEIDLLRAGSNPSREKFPELSASPYFLFLDRKLGRVRKEEGCPVRLQTPLPTVRLPLGPDRADLPLNLTAVWTAVMNRCWRDDWGADFVGDPPGPLSSDDREWVHERMQSWTAPA